MNAFTLSVRRNNFLKSFRNEQRQEIKTRERMKLLNVLNPIAEVRCLRQRLKQYNIQYFQSEISEIIRYLQTYSHSLDFCREVRDERLIEDLIVMTAGELKNKPFLEMAGTLEMLISLVYQLLSQPLFLSTVETNFSLIVFCLYKYPCHQILLEKISQIITFLESGRPESLWKRTYMEDNICGDESLVSRLLEIYILQESYQSLYMGQGEIVRKGDEKWFANAIKCLQISYSLMCLHLEREAFWQKATIRQGLCESLRMSNEKQCWMEEWESSDSETICQYNIGFKAECCDSKQESKLYFISLSLDLLMLKEELLSEAEAALLQQILGSLLNGLSRYRIISVTATKVIKILYEQVILNDEELMQLGQTYPTLQPEIINVINNDFI